MWATASQTPIFSRMLPAARIAAIRRQLIVMANRAFVLLLLSSAVAAFAAEPNVERGNRDAPPAQQSPSISAQDAAAIVRQTYGGRVVSAVEAKRNINGEIKRGYDVRVDVEGRVKTVFVDRRGRIHEQR